METEAATENYFMRFIYFCFGIHSEFILCFCHITLNYESHLTNSFHAFHNFVYFIQVNSCLMSTHIFQCHPDFVCWLMWNMIRKFADSTKTTPDKDSFVPFRSKHLFILEQRCEWFFFGIGICLEWQIVVDISLTMIVLWNWTLAC